MARMLEKSMSEEADNSRPTGWIVKRWWTVWLFGGLGLVISTFLPGPDLALGILAISSMELFVIVGIPAAFVTWVFMVTRYFGSMQREGLAGYAAKAILVVLVTWGVAGLTTSMIAGPQRTMMWGVWCRLRIFADVQDIRAWGEQVELKEEDANGNYAGELPAFITRLRPSRVMVDPISRTINIHIDEGPWLHGLLVGAKDAQREEVRKPEMGVMMKLRPGAWLWHEL